MRDTAPDPAGALDDVLSAQPVAQADQALRLGVDLGQRGAEFMRDHGDEVALQLGHVLFVRQFLLQHGRLFRQVALAVHQFDRIAAKHHDRAGHLADFVAAAGVCRSAMPVSFAASWCIARPRSSSGRDTERRTSKIDDGQHQAGGQQAPPIISQRAWLEGTHRALAGLAGPHHIVVGQAVPADRSRRVGGARHRPVERGRLGIARPPTGR